MMMSKALILPFFLLAGMANGDQQPQPPQGVAGSNYYGEDTEGGSLQGMTTSSYGEEDKAPKQVFALGDDGAAYLEDGHELSNPTDVYDDNHDDNDEEVVDESRLRRQLRGNNNRRLSGRECEIANPFNNCPRGQTCWRRRVGSSWNGNGTCVQNDACLPMGVFMAVDVHSAQSAVSYMTRRCCSRRVSRQGNFAVCSERRPRPRQVF